MAAPTLPVAIMEGGFRARLKSAGGGARTLAIENKQSNGLNCTSESLVNKAGLGIQDA